MATTSFPSCAKTMSVPNPSQENDESEDSFQYEEVPLEDDCSLTEGEEDLEATVKAIQDRAAVAAAARSNSSTTHKPEEPVDNFLRNFLFQMGMTETLDHFQAEWAEMLHKGLVTPEQVGVVPEVYVENKHLESALENAQREREEYNQAKSASAETLERLQKARDFHMLQHKRAVQEKNALIKEMRKLQTQCSGYEPEVKRMSGKYEAVLKQTMMMSLEKDKEKSAHSTSNCVDISEEGAVNTTGESYHTIQPRPPSSAKPQRASPRRACV
ncbi:sperm-associated antigen 16 protein-like isoform X2 [Xyrichtys novacula]|uniref:Sperm-associated antigen 16 protein-like isoform X2 n=1 Tax=Xyrichtys novacula TaxID=13765 RepID=A0AAV1H8P2_XYRNO|nr:sperm-associated antigen 16 protein-like isoform X2 [Xyrichtys novacula]